METHTIDRQGVRLSVRIGDAFTACQVDEATDSRHCRIHPHLVRLPGGRLILTANIDGDIGGAEFVAYASDDDGATWRDYPEWPKIGGAFAVLATGEALLAAGNRLYAAGEPGVYCLPIRRSQDGGLTWSPPEASRVDLPLPMEEPLDRYDPPAWFLDRTVGGQSGRAWLAKWQKPAPTPAEEALRAQFGRRTLTAYLMQIFPLAGEKALAFLYLNQQWGDPHITVCLATEDAGRTWAYRSTPGPCDPRALPRMATCGTSRMVYASPPVPGWPPASCSWSCEWAASTRSTQPARAMTA
ncbi:MAG: sialidase family protein [Armatimonadota bacterium]